jgi:16S rRNA (cytosine1402-N4)-methyltransferase
MRHVPVMLDEVLEALGPERDEVLVDATLGAGGYARAMLERARSRVVAFDRDPSAIASARAWADEYGDRLMLINRPFSELEAGAAEAGFECVDGATFDLGVSSMQLDEAERGFSFQADGRLSMRMDMGKPDAADVVNAAEASDLAEIFRTFGEERHAGRIARAIVERRSDAPIVTTGELASVVAAASPKGAEKIHPATRVFQALRIFVNDELGELVRGLLAAERLLRPAGRLIVVTFHSLEDRIVKRFLADRSGHAPGLSRHVPEQANAEPTFELLSAKPRTPSDAEIARNPRARSAKLRAAVRLKSAARPDSGAFAPAALRLSSSLHQWR